MDKINLAAKYENSKILGDITMDVPLHKYWGDMSPLSHRDRPPCRSAHQVYNYQLNKRQSIANCCTDREMSVISTYLNDNAQTPLCQFVVDIL